MDNTPSTNPQALAHLDQITFNGWCSLAIAAHLYAKQNPSSPHAQELLNCIIPAAELLGGFGAA